MSLAKAQESRLEVSSVFLVEAQERSMPKLTRDKNLADKINERKKRGRKSSVCPIPLRPRILLHPNIPKPMHKMAPRVVLGKKWWNNERQEAYERTGFHCLACGVRKEFARFKQWLEGHELYSINYSKGRMTYVETVALCHCCHNYIHDGRLQTLLEKREITQQKYVAIIQHGDKVLSDAGLSRKKHSERIPKNIASWGSWRLVIDGVEYEGRFKSIEEWEEYHENS